MDTLLTVEQAAERLGTTERFVRRLIAERRIAYVKLGRHVRIAPSDLEAFIVAGPGLRVPRLEGLASELMARKGRRAFGSVRQLASGRWQARYLDAAGVRHTAPRTFPPGGGDPLPGPGRDRSAAREWADPKLGRVTFEEWVSSGGPTTANLRPGTLVLYDYLLRRFLLPAFGPVPLGRLDMMTVRAWLADLHRAGEVTPTTIAKAYRLLRRILNVAVEAGYCRVTRAR